MSSDGRPPNNGPRSPPAPTEARREPPSATRTEAEGATLDLPEGVRMFNPGQVLGERYQILEMLGSGGMGEVWHAFDLKLRVEVALKALRGDLFKSERRLELLRQEVRAAREVVSPNVCRIFDLIEVEGRELVSMEYVDGATLLGVLQERGPLELKEAQDIASQFLAGLEAIHKVGLIHRDIKPENIMLTRAGRVVVMDFGLARQEAEGGGTVSGTPAYMAPEQAAGQTLDARADVYAAGVVLAEMVSPEGVKSYESRQSVWEGVRSEPAKLPDSPWAPAIKKAVAKDREQRYHTAHTLTRALEDVTLRVEGAEDLHPYPGLASFTEEDTEYFFGREAEVEQMWRKLEGPPRLLAIIGPSGAGKSSFIAAGLVANAPPNWGIIRSTPGNTAISSLASVVARETAGDPDAVELLPRSGDADVAVQVLTHWGQKNTHSLLVVDQFEELFTQNAPDEQRPFADLLSRFVLEGNVHVLLSMRDDFAASCHTHESLRPIFHELTVLGPPTGANLRRALVQPATKCGYRFEDDELADEMLAEVEGERGALPMLAFAAARLWEKRDRETGLLTRHAYHDIGGVGGALARHAEATIDRIGTDRIAIVRELFRNLVTAEGTRAVRDWDELLSVFSDSQSESPEEVLRELIDARLLTSYEVREEDEEPTRRVEIIHESLLANWPRLVRWQTQDADAAQLRDQLRRAARTWEEHGRTDDTLWTGSAHMEFALWRERYPGGLTELEEAFATAMTAHARRRKRRLRIAVAATVIVLLAVLGIVGVSRQQAIAEANRAEASKLLALAQVQLDRGPTEALAYATTSLELADTEEARIFAMKALWHAPPALVLAGAGMSGRWPSFRPDGTWLAAAGHDDEVLVWPENGGEPLRLPGHTVIPASRAGWTAPGLLVTGNGSDHVRVWSMPEGRLIRTIDFSSPTRTQVGETHLFAEVSTTILEGEPRVLELRRWKLPDGQAEDLGSIDWTALGASSSAFDPSGRGWIFARGDTVYYRPLPLRDDKPGLVIGRHDNDAAVLTPRAAEPDRVWSQDRVTGERRCWSLSTPSLEPLEVIPAPPEAAKRRYAVRSGTGKWRLGRKSGEKAPWLWDLGLLPGGQPLQLRTNTDWYGSVMDLHPACKWLVASAENWDQLRFWPLVKAYPSVVEGYSGSWKPVVFSPDGEWFATGWGDGYLRLWPLPTGEPRELQVLEAPRFSFYTNLAFDRTGENLVTTAGSIFVVSLGGGAPRQLDGFSSDQIVWSTAFSPSGRLVAAGAGYGTGKRKVLRVWDLETGEVRVFDLEAPPTEPEGIAESRAVETGFENVVWTVLFEDESTLLTAGAGGVRRWNLETGTSEVVIQTAPEVVMRVTMSDDQATLVAGSERFDPSARYEGVAVHHLAAGTSRALDLFGDRVKSFTTDPTGEVLVTGDMEGIVRVGRIDADEPHLLLGHEQAVDGVAISPDLEWIVSAGQDETLRLWPMPDLSKPPLHTLPHDELIAKLKTLTNLRVVRDEDSPSGWKLTVGPFPGWETVPTW